MSSYQSYHTQVDSPDVDYTAHGDSAPTPAPTEVEWDPEALGQVSRNTKERASE